MKIPLFQLGKLSPKLRQLVSLRSLVKNGVDAFALKSVLQILPNEPVTCTVSCLRKKGGNPFLDSRVSVGYEGQTIWFADKNLEPSEKPIPRLIPLWLYNAPCNGIAMLVTVLTSCDQQGSLAYRLQECTIQTDHSPYASKSPYRYAESHKKNLNFLFSSTSIWMTVLGFFNFNMW